MPGKPRQSDTRSEPDSPYHDGPDKLRLHKAMADAGVDSRRNCEQIIETGQVKINGKTVSRLPAWINPTTDRLTVKGRPVNLAEKSRKIYIAVYKPRNVICTNHDPQGRTRVIDLVPYTERLYTVGRLDADSHGLVLLTNDGELTHRLTHPRYGVAKCYLVTVAGVVSEQEIMDMRKGIFLADEQGKSFKVAADRVRVIERGRDRCKLEIILREGKNREIRRMLAKLAHPVKKLQRIAIGPLELGKMKSGNWRELTPDEVRKLRAATRPARTGKSRTKHKKNRRKP